jgi:DegV family protein with EDD domain
MVRVVTDSSCDLPHDVLRELGVSVVPLVVRIGKEEFLETDLSIDEFWERVAAARAQGIFPQTSQPSPGAFESVFATLVGGGNEVVCATITSKHSGTFNTAWAAAQGFGDAVRIVDSWTTSLGLGLLAKAAARAAHEGARLGELEAVLTDMRARTHLLAVLNTIDYIRVGGRASALIPALSRVMRFLTIKPIIGFVEGELKLQGHARTFSAALARIEQRIVELRPLESLAVLHTRREREAETAADSLRRSTGFEGPIPMGETGAVLSSHAGPGVVGMIAVQKGGSSRS